MKIFNANWFLRIQSLFIALIYLKTESKPIRAPFGIPGSGPHDVIVTNKPKTTIKHHNNKPTAELRRNGAERNIPFCAPRPGYYGL